MLTDLCQIMLKVTPYQGQLFDGLLRTRLAATRVFVDGIPVPIYFAGPNEGVATVPDSVEGKDFVGLQVEDIGALSPIVRIPIVSAAPVLFSEITRRDGSTVSEASPAMPGEDVLLRANGLGRFTSSETTASPLLPTTVVIRSGGRDLEAHASCCT